MLSNLGIFSIVLTLLISFLLVYNSTILFKKNNQILLQKIINLSLSQLFFSILSLFESVMEEKNCDEKVKLKNLFNQKFCNQAEHASSVNLLFLHLHHNCHNNSNLGLGKVLHIMNFFGQMTL